MKPKTKLVTLKMPAELAARVYLSAEESGSTASEVIREAVAEYLAKERPVQAGSALALAGDLAGSLTGVSDLATNPKHLKGFGR
jgi:predicted transcriptional regulator